MVTDFVAINGYRLYTQAAVRRLIAAIITGGMSAVPGEFYLVSSGYWLIAFYVVVDPTVKADRRLLLREINTYDDIDRVALSIWEELEQAIKNKESSE